MWQKVDKSGKSAPAVRTVTIGLDKGREKEAKDGRAATLGERRRWASGDVVIPARARKVASSVNAVLLRCS